MSKEGMSTGVDTRGEMAGRFESSIGDVTSGDRGLGHSLEQQYQFSNTWGVSDGRLLTFLE